MTTSAPSTPRAMHSTPRRRRRPSALQTPECYSKVTMDTPRSANRRQSRDKNDQERNLTVAVRVRPMNSRELAYVGVSDVVNVRDSQVIIRNAQIGGLNTLNHIFEYDHVFWSCDEHDEKYAGQQDVFQTIGIPLLDSAFKGYNACLFAYGQTGAGKSYSMMGENANEGVGIIPRFCKHLFDRIDSLDKHCAAAVEVSYFEIYNEKIHDLLSNANQKTALKVREHPIWGPYVVDLSVHPVKSFEELREWLFIGNSKRATAATSMNEKSSRSHSIFTIEICLNTDSTHPDTSRRSKISLVDLAGSERISGNANNDERMRQGVSINKSLLTLGKVIAALADGKGGTQFAPYRDSVLTWLLRESLGGNSLTSMLATITPASSNIDETLATLRYACQARSIVNRARINENPHDKLIRELRGEVERLRALRQDYERNSPSATLTCSINLSNLSNTSEAELEELRLKLSEKEAKLEEAEKSWQQQFMETKQRQMHELAEAEKRQEELESHIRVMNIIDTNVNLSPYRSNFLEELEDIVSNCNTLNKPEKIMTHSEVANTLDHVYDLMKSLRPTVDTLDDNVKLQFARINKLLQSFDTALKNNFNGHSKKVTFKL